MKNFFLFWIIKFPIYFIGSWIYIMALLMPIAPILIIYSLITHNDSMSPSMFIVIFVSLYLLYLFYFRNKLGKKVFKYLEKNREKFQEFTGDFRGEDYL